MKKERVKLKSDVHEIKQPKHFIYKKCFEREDCRNDGNRMATR